MTTFEEAKRCPRCKEPGREDRVKQLGGGAKLFTIICTNPVCRWFNTGWVIQVDANGEIPTRKPNQKDYPEVPSYIWNAGMREVDTIAAAEAGDKDAAHEIGLDGSVTEVPRKGR